jgi:hypothetical protein
MYVNFIDNPQYDYAEITQEAFECFDKRRVRDALPGFPLIYADEEVEHAWYIVGKDITQCKIIAAIRYMADATSGFTEEPHEEYNNNFEDALKEIIAVFDEEVEPMNLTEFFIQQL